MITRHDLEDEEWARLEPLLPRNPGRGGRWADHRRTINGILFRTRAGCPWRDLPEEYGHWLTVYKRHRRWSYDGTWAEIVQVLRAGCDEAEGRDWAVSADSTVVRAHQHAAGARRRLRRTGRGGQCRMTTIWPGGRGWAAHGRCSTKIHLIADRRCRPLTRITTPGQHGDCPQFIPLMNQLAIRRRGKGGPAGPGAALGDKAYSSAANRTYLRKRGIKAVIAVKEDQKNHRRRRSRRPPALEWSRALQRPQHRRALLWQAQAVQSGGHPL